MHSRSLAPPHSVTGSEATPLVPQRIFVDATYTLCSGKNSGIERVVRSIIRESRLLSTELVPQIVIAHGGQFYALDQQQLARLAKPAKFQGNILSQMPKVYRKIASCLCKMIPLRTLRKWVMPEAGHLGIFKLPHAYYESYSRGLAVRTAQLVVPTSNDLFLLPDAYWARRGIWSAVRKSQRRRGNDREPALRFNSNYPPAIRKPSPFRSVQSISASTGYPVRSYRGNLGNSSRTNERVFANPLR